MILALIFAAGLHAPHPEAERNPRKAIDEAMTRQSLIRSTAFQIAPPD